MKLKDYILEYVSSGRRSRKLVVFTEKDKLNDWISKLEILGFNVENEEDQKDHWKWRDECWGKLDKNTAIVLFQTPSAIEPERLEPKQVVFIYNKKEYQIDFDKDGKIEPTHHFHDPSRNKTGYFFVDTKNLIDILNKDIEEGYES